VIIPDFEAGIVSSAVAVSSVDTAFDEGFDGTATTGDELQKFF
jgi:hypothetical protein